MGIWLYPSMTALSLLVVLLAHQGHLPFDAAVLLTSAIGLFLAASLTRRWPHQALWQQNHGDQGCDLTSAVVLGALVDPAVKSILPLIALLALPQAPDQTHTVGTSGSFAVQLLGALLWIEFAKYWSHRLHHQWPMLWRLHAMHHSSRRLYWLNGLRMNPLNHVLNTLLSMGPLIWVGIASDVLLAALVITQPILMLQHANLNFQHGWLNRIFSTHELHRQHHSTDPTIANRNFGSAFVIWDQIFGTWHAPHKSHTRQTVGLFESGIDSSPYPGDSSYWVQLRNSIALPNCCKPSSQA